jgi:hypothetical protein
LILATVPAVFVVASVVWAAFVAARVASVAVVLELEPELRLLFRNSGKPLLRLVLEYHNYYKIP